jgi:hypothetical protein
MKKSLLTLLGALALSWPILSLTGCVGEVEGGGYYYGGPWYHDGPWVDGWGWRGGPRVYGGFAVHPPGFRR